MKILKYIIAVAVCALFASCMGDSYADPQTGEEAPYGNNAIQETNVLTIKDLKAKYASTIANSSMEEVKEDIQIKGWVTGNDVEGNLYNQFAIQDETGALLVSVAQGGMYGYLPEGQQVLISLKGLIIGGYGSQAQLGGVYVSATGTESVGRMSRYMWESHYKLLGAAGTKKIEPTIFDASKMSNADYLAENAGKLMTFKGVTLADADGKAVFAPDDGSASLVGGAVNRNLGGYSSQKIVVRTSTYADFANMPLPQGKVDITGIFTRFRNTWQILLRTASDVQPASGQ